MKAPTKIILIHHTHCPVCGRKLKRVQPFENDRHANYGLCPSRLDECGDANYYYMGERS